MHDENYWLNYNAAFNGLPPPDPLSQGAIDGAIARNALLNSSSNNPPSVSVNTAGVPWGIIGLCAFGAAAIVFNATTHITSDAIKYVSEANGKIKDNQSLHKYRTVLDARKQEIAKETIQNPLIAFGFQCVHEECTAKGFKIRTVYFSNFTSASNDAGYSITINSIQYPERELRVSFRMQFAHSPNYGNLGYDINEKIAFSVIPSFLSFQPRQQDQINWRVKQMPAGEYLAAQQRTKDPKFLKPELLEQEFKELKALLEKAPLTGQPTRVMSLSGVSRPAMLNGQPVKSPDWIFPLSLILDK
ncbi:MAG: hypothetical protein SFW65_04025 [Alphaproteobacteria bacterium]|nr:hypothetical protein [Alphaproteobacteria bacterium]